MVIVSQNGNYIINFDNAKGISIIEYDNYNRRSYEAEIIIRFNNEDVILGKYKTKERAKEVLQEIRNMYCCTQIVMIPKMYYETEIKGEDLAKMIAYQMPKE